jgi:Cu(I)/Ag(I) efflux system periplasmic protein CusF
MRPLAKAVTALLSALTVSTALAAEWASAEIRRVDVPNQRMTLKHGEIKSLDMPPMTMVFYVKEAVLLEGLKPNDKIEFQAVVEGKKYIVTAIRKPGDSK